MHFKLSYNSMCYAVNRIVEIYFLEIIDENTQLSASIEVSVFHTLYAQTHDVADLELFYI